MSLRTQWIINIVMVVLSWLSIPLLGWKSIKRFMPSAILVFIICCFDVRVGKKRKWWIFYNKPKSYISNELPFMIGPNLALSLWALKWTYGNFKKFITLNVLSQAMFATFVTRFFTKLKIYKLGRFSEFHFFLYFFYKVFFLYGFQYLFERVNGNSRA